MALEACTQNLLYPIQKYYIVLKNKLKILCKGTKPQNNFCILVKFHTK
jgi:hypothetical protein